ncbi:MAG: DUF4236 domain-containing protein [Candidatus Omnitrophica bacterium]|jgi:hypothetical protein|nr:DUF4236 domain-containing protein [Candidatus Omnitrophota bacterium]MDD5070365.1 DUF4236 domain-containing protein [Candidatus Omnitrophota bacterium]
MGWYIRKSFSAGPVRFNLSKSGLGLSFGVKGARVGVGPKGAYSHFGAGGLYYRTPYVSPGPTVNLQNDISLGENGALFNKKQINRKRLDIEFYFNVKKETEWMCLTVGTAFFITTGVVCKSVSFGAGTTFLILGIVAYFWVIFSNIERWILKQKSDSLYSKLKTECCKYEKDDFVVDVAKLKEVANKCRQNLDIGYFKRALCLFYKDYLNSVISDFRISDKERDNLQAVEEALNLDEDLLKKIKLYVFNRVYLFMVEDKILTKEEEADIFKIKNIFSLKDADVIEEMETLKLLRETREIIEKDLQPIDVDISLGKNEISYHQTMGRIVKEKTLKSYQEQGVRHAIKGLVTEKEGMLYLTSQRMIIVGEGVYNIKLSKIYNIETDIDKNTIAIDIDGRKNPLILTVPDSLIFSTKLNKLKK